MKSEMSGLLRHSTHPTDGPHLPNGRGGLESVKPSTQAREQYLFQKVFKWITNNLYAVTAFIVHYFYSFQFLTPRIYLSRSLPTPRKYVPKQAASQPNWYEALILTRTGSKTCILRQLICWLIKSTDEKPASLKEGLAMPNKAWRNQAADLTLSP